MNMEPMKEHKGFLGPSDRRQEKGSLPGASAASIRPLQYSLGVIERLSEQNHCPKAKANVKRGPLSTHLIPAHWRLRQGD